MGEGFVCMESLVEVEAYKLVRQDLQAGSHSVFVATPQRFWADPKEMVMVEAGDLDQVVAFVGM